MSEGIETTGPKKRSPLIWLLLALILSPLTCCGGYFILSALPGVTAGLFETEVHIENHTDETLYITPITTTYAEPRVITQSSRIRQVDVPLRPDRSVLITYDAADMPLSGVAVCREKRVCRLLETEYSGLTVLDSFEALPALDPGWLQAMQTTTRYSFGIVIFPLLGLVPVVLFLIWLNEIWRRRNKGNETLYN
jgi:hypothetical protein